MIISHKHKFIFIKTRKTASTAMEIALSAICGPDDVLTPLSGNDEDLRFELTGMRAQNFKLPLGELRLKDWLRWIKNWNRPRHTNHQSADLTRQRVGIELWQDYFTFALDREPKAKLLSHYQWLKMLAKCADPQEYISKQYYKKIKAAQLYADNEGSILVNAVFPMESMEKTNKAIAAKLNIPYSNLKFPPQKVKKSTPVSHRERDELIAHYERYLQDEFALEAALFMDDLHK